MVPEENQNTTSAQTVTAQGVFGFPEGCRVVLNRTMSDLALQMIASAAPEVAGTMQNVNGQTAMLAIANDDLVELHFENPINLPASGGRPALSCQNVVARLRRTEQDRFEFSTSATNPDPQGAPLSFVVDGLTAGAQVGSVVFSSNNEPKLRSTPASASGAPINLEAFTAPYLSKAPGFLRSFIPDVMGLVSLTQVFEATSVPPSDSTSTAPSDSQSHTPATETTETQY